MRVKKLPVFIVEYQGLICAVCNHPIIWQDIKKEIPRKEQLKHISLATTRKAAIITISEKCQCGCTTVRD